MNLSLLTPEFLLIVTGLLLLALDLFIVRDDFYFAVDLSILGVISAIVIELNLFGLDESVAGALIFDQFSAFLKVLFLATLLTVLFLSREYMVKFKNRAEYCFILLLSTCGMMMAVSANEMITLYISIELISISFYILVTYLRDRRSIEAGIKYLLFGATSSALFLYGVSLLYGISGTSNLYEAGSAIIGREFSSIQLLTLVFIFAGIAFKCDLVPFHCWVPDAYEGAPTPITSYLATGSKVTGFAIMMRLLFGPFGCMLFSWHTFFALLAAVTIILGNLSAIPQTNIKRLLAYSGIAHAGYLAIGLAVYSSLGTVAILFYFVVYSIATLGIFCVIAATGIEDVDEYKGFCKRCPYLALIMLISLSSLAGLPPLAGFVGKFIIFSSALHKGMLWLAIIGVVFSVVSVYYYFKIVKVCYFESSDKEEPIYVPFHTKTLLSILTIGIILFGIVPQRIIEKLQAVTISIAGIY